MKWILVRPDSFGGDVYVRDSADGGITYTRSFSVYGRNSDVDAQWLADRLNLLDRLEDAMKGIGSIGALPQVVTAKVVDGDP